MNRSDWSSNLVLDFDGACWPNPGGCASYGWVIRDEALTILHEGQGVVKLMTRTNNVAEWHGMMEGLNALLNASWEGSLLIRGDSALVIKQLTGEWRCKKEMFAEYRKGALQVLGEICGSDWRTQWIPRENNRDADRLSRVAYKTATGSELPL